MPAPTTPIQLLQRGVEALVRELGPVEAIRFIHMLECGQGDYTEERANILPHWSVAEVLCQANVLRPGPTP